MSDTVSIPTSTTPGPKRRSRRYDTLYTAIYHVRHAGHEIGQTEQLQGSAEVTALLLDTKARRNVAVGTFASHEAAAEAVIKAWKEST
jgi:hypothetical protein